MKILIAGDFCPKGRVSDLLKKGCCSGILSDCKPMIDSSDYSIVNFECPVVRKGFEPIVKKGPNLSCDESAVALIQHAGFDCVTLANNHFRDFGDEGCKATLQTLNRNSIDYVGGGMSLKEAQKVFYKDINGRRLSIVNFCENEFSIATDERAGSAPLNLIDNYHQIKEARKNADFVIVIIHGGHEFFQLPSLRMKKTYRWLIELGADSVINHHQHCFSGFEIYNSKPIFYGLGNFCFDWESRRDGSWNEGYMVSLDLNDTSITFETIPYSQCNSDPKVSILYGSALESFRRRITRLNEIIVDDVLLKSYIEEYYKKCIPDCEIMLGNFSENKLVRALKRRGLIGRSINQAKRNILSDYIFCESHKDKVDFYLNRKSN